MAPAPADAPPAPDARHDAPPPAWPAAAPTTLLRGLTVALAVALLYFGRAIIVPFALAALLAFILDPLVTGLKRRGVPRSAAVALVVAVTVAVLGATSLFVGSQLVQVSRDLPTYQTTIQAKLRAARQLLTRHTLLDDAARMLDVVGGEFDEARKAIDAASHHRVVVPPLRVQVEPTPRSAFQAVADVVEPLLAPVGTAGMVLVFLVFVLLEGDAMRDRVLRLVGGDLHRTTDALSDAAERLSRYLTTQLMVNLSYGVPMAAGLWLIGVPGALLWGLIAAMMRFVPYVGTAIASLLPLAVAFAVDPGWQMVAWTLALVLTLEVVCANIVEPWLYGASTGLSGMSVVAAAVFWTALWGPVGLILSTPLTACLVVLGRHLAPLRWLEVLLGSRPVFDSATRLYQRLLADDLPEAVELAREQVRREGLVAFYDGTALPALRQAANDHQRAASADHRHRVASGMGWLIQDLGDEPPPDAAGPVDPAAEPRVLCIGARWEIDTLAAEMTAHALTADGIAARALPASAATADPGAPLPLAGARMVCVSTFHPVPEALVRFIVRRLRRRHPQLLVVAALWNVGDAATADDLAAASLGVDGVVTTVAEALQLARARAGDAALPAAALQAARTPADEPRRQAAVEASGLRDAALRPLLDRAAQRAADVLDLPCALVSLVDAGQRVTIGSSGAGAPRGGEGGEATIDLAALQQGERATSPCGHVVAAGALLEVGDTGRDARFAPSAVLRDARVRYYAGAPLRAADGSVLGALCVLAPVPHRLGAGECRLLQAMADDLMQRLAEHAPPPPAEAPTATAPASRPAILPRSAAMPA